MKLSKYHLNLAGEYRVCSELLKRGIFATVTYGDMKSVDVVAVGSNRRAAIIEVKTSQSMRFVTGFYQKYRSAPQEHPTFWVLYNIGAISTPSSEQFFVLTHDELARIQAERNHHGKSKMSWEQTARRFSRGVDNFSVPLVMEHQDAWHKIVTYCSQRD